MRHLLNHALRLAAAGLAFYVFLNIGGILARPDLPDQPRAAKRPQTANRLNARIDPANPLVLYREVDYAEGPSAPWYPKGESPILAALVEEGKLPPVAERVGPEPLVVEGVEGIGKYGGTWIKIASSQGDIAHMIGGRMCFTTLVRWSPQGYPIVPHVAKSYEASPDYREYTFHLRQGMKWSDGHPFTADDIMFWWQYWVNSEAVGWGAFPDFMMVRGKRGKVVKVNDRCVKFIFPAPNGLFLEALTSKAAERMLNAPAHYMRQFHPEVGNQGLIQRRMKSLGLTKKRSLYSVVRSTLNPERPSLGPWLYRTHKTTPPLAIVRNPYFFMVDTAGNQLPYVDRVLFDQRSAKMIPLAAAAGEITMQHRHIDYAEYTHLMSQREENGYEILHWYSANSSSFLLAPNINRRIEPDQPETRNKHNLLYDRRFRQALSLAINRRQIIRAQYFGQGEPAQSAPRPESPFYHPRLYKSCAEYDPAHANALLDELGLLQRDYEGYRTFKNGSRMVFYINYSNYTGAGPIKFLIDDWAAVGIRVVQREKSPALQNIEASARKHDISVWIGTGEYLPFLAPRPFVPIRRSLWAKGYGRWYENGGLYGSPKAVATGCIAPPQDHPARRAMELYERVKATGDHAERRRLFNRIMDIAADNIWTISAGPPVPELVVVKNGFRNVPRDVVAGTIFRTPNNAGEETYYFEQAQDSFGAIVEILQAITTITPLPAFRTARNAQGFVAFPWARATGYVLAVFALIGLATLGIKYPYIGRRVLIMIPTLLIISVAVFIIIQLPPGDYATSRIVQHQESGDNESIEELIRELVETFHLDKPMIVRYGHWMGLYWFVSFDNKDKGLLQGDLGVSMATGREVNRMIGDRILLTFLISLGTILFTWAVALPIGIYSAVRQYSIGDYILTFIGFLGMCIPGFLLALVLMTLGGVSGLFSPEYAAQPEWSWGKVGDLLKHIWVPLLVMGISGTAGMIRVMRGNLLDELRKPYVVTARAKGVRPLKLLFKYPVRLALNPFVSSIGGIFPRLVSGGAIVAIVLSLPTVGPLMLSALMDEDMYLAGSMLMVLSALAVIGMLVSDLLLLALDPRIRFKGGRR